MKAPVSGQLFVCGKRTPDLPPCVCGAARRSDVSCRFALSGAKAGQFCAKPLCQRCAQKVDGKTLCQAHARLVAMRDQNAAAVVKNGADDPVTAKIRAVYEELIAAKASIQRIGAP